MNKSRKSRKKKKGKNKIKLQHGIKMSTIKRMGYRRKFGGKK